jgi:hypothetical protein
MGGAAICEIRLPGENLPPVMCQFRPQRNQFGQIETVMDLFDAEGQAVVDTRVLRHGEVVRVHPFTLRYFNFAEQEPIVIPGGYYV